MTVNGLACLTVLLYAAFTVGCTISVANFSREIDSCVAEYIVQFRRRGQPNYGDQTINCMCRYKKKRTNSETNKFVTETEQNEVKSQTKL